MVGAQGAVGDKSEAEFCGWVASPQRVAEMNQKQQNLVPSKVICCGGEG